MAELIDRNDTLKIICDTIALYGTGSRAESEILSIVSKIPSAEPKWIPTSERVPRNEGVYLVTVRYHVEGMPPETKVARFYNGSWEFDDCRAVSLFSKVVAWMVMPDPYKGLNERSER